MKKLLTILFVFTFINFCQAAQEIQAIEKCDKSRLKTFKFLNTSELPNSEFKQKVDQLIQLEQLANCDINLKYFKINNKTNSDFAIILKKENETEEIDLPRNTSLGTELELLTNADSFQIKEFFFKIKTYEPSSSVKIENNTNYVFKDKYFYGFDWGGDSFYRHLTLEKYPIESDTWLTKILKQIS